MENILKNNDWKYKFIFHGIKMFLKSVPYCFSYLVCLDVYRGVVF